MTHMQLSSYVRSLPQLHLILYTTYQSLLESFGIKTKELSMKFCVILVVLYGGFITNLIMDTAPITTVQA